MNGQVGKLGMVIKDEKFNAIISWLVIVFLGIVFIVNIWEDLIFNVFVAGVGVLMLIPPAKKRSWKQMLPWELAVASILPILGGSFNLWFLSDRFYSYFSLAAAALIVSVDLHYFTDVSMSEVFAVFFVGVTTIAGSGVWSLTLWFWDNSFGTNYLPSEQAFAYNAVSAMFAGLIAGAVFYIYLDRVSGYQARLDEGGGY
ncbi:MAG: hypothetical protein ABEK59_02410 [Halobacteria archaeon]